MAKRTLLLKYLRKIPSIFWWLLLLIFLVIAVPWLTSPDRHFGSGQARLTFSDAPQNLTIGQPFSVQLTLHTLTTTNAIGLDLHYNPKMLEIVQMTTSQSFCSFYTENRFDNIKGEVQLSCGTPNPGFSGDSIILNLTMRAKNSGNTSITVDRNTLQVLANDGKGTNLINQAPKLDVAVLQTF